MSNLLKNNAYHILGLDTSATQKDVLKRSKDIIKLIQIDDLPHYDFDIDVFENFRTEDTVKEAVHKLTSPKKQIKDYFFWFNIADSVDEQAVGILRKNDPEGAARVWEHHSEGDSTKAIFYKKNLAILYCLLIFKKDDEHYLKSSLKIWHEILNSPKFWPAFTKVYKLNDELNTSQETVTEFQKQCVSYLSDLYTEIAGARKDNKYIAQFSSVFNMKGDKTSKTVLSPIFDAMTVAIEKLESIKVAEDGVLDKEESAFLKENVTIIQNGCNKLIELGLYDDSHTKVIRDRAAAALRSISIDLNNHLNETSVALGLSKIADKISGTEGFKNKLQEDLKQIQKNDDHNKNEEKFKKITDPILEDFKNGNAERALKSINEHIYNDTTEEALKKELRELKEIIEARIAKHGKPAGTPSMGTFNTVGFKMYGDTNYFVVLFIPLIPISRWSCEDHGDGTYTFYGKLELTQKQKNWRTVAIIIIIGLVIWGFNS
ncbi:MAG: hypothetical protein A2910_01950 [Candidatus Yanofskybacteria bacterium RIFCSPLOWO2_01_FULL_39_28]|nr:MAG: hypothetical protein A2910_01950 [Candidatus Yanofskybacteria bacterium RIFCSPLOWO2_01_FULL_39_28]